MFDIIINQKKIIYTMIESCKGNGKMQWMDGNDNEYGFVGVEVMFFLCDDELMALKN